MSETGMTTRFAIPLFVLFFVLGGLALAGSAGRIDALNFRWMAHIGALLMLMAGTMLMWKAEHKG